MAASTSMVRLDDDDVASASALVLAIQRELSGVVITAGSGDSFVFYDPEQITDPERRFPFATVVTGDRYDAASRLDRDDHTYRVNLGVGRSTYEGLFGAAPREPAGSEVIDIGVDYAQVDTVLPHPFYAPMHWLCVVNPGPRTLRPVGSLLAEAHGLARKRYRGRPVG